MVEPYWRTVEELDVHGAQQGHEHHLHGDPFWVHIHAQPQLLHCVVFCRS